MHKSGTVWPVIVAKSLCVVTFFNVIHFIRGASDSDGGNYCTFPTFLTNRPRWDTHVSLERQSIGSIWSFTANKAKSIDYTVPPEGESLSYDCLQKISNSEGTVFFVRISSDASILTSNQGPLRAADSTYPTVTGYRCLKFVERSPNVVQLYKSAVLTQSADPNWCSITQLVLDRHPLIWPRADDLAGSSCGIIGGFSFSLQLLTGNASSNLICAETPRPPIMEANCNGQGEGIAIEFRQFNCMDRLSLAISSRLRCLGAWTESTSGYTFSVLSDGGDLWPKVWMFRFPATAGQSFIGHLSTEIITSVDAQMTPSSADDLTYAVHMSAASFYSLCQDEAIGCATDLCAENDGNNTATYGGQLSEIYCQRTCNTCLADSGDTKSCSFPNDVRGSWSEMSTDPTRAGQTITINQQGIIFSSINSVSKTTCVDFKSYFTSVNMPTRFPVSTIYPSSGCRPRYQCVELTRRSDAVLTYRIGKTIYWPYDAWSSMGNRMQLTKDILCNDDMFQTDSASRSSAATNSIHNLRIVLGQPQSAFSPVDCKFPRTPGWMLMEGHSSNGYNQTALISQCDNSLTVSQFHFSIISSSTFTNADSQLADGTHSCLAVFFDSSTGDRYMATVADSEYYCWVFQNRFWSQKTRVYVTKASDCNSNTGIDIEVNQYAGYFATFDVEPLSIQAAAASLEHTLPNDLINECSDHTDYSISTLTYLHRSTTNILSYGSYSSLKTSSPTQTQNSDSLKTSSPTQTQNSDSLKTSSPTQPQTQNSHIVGGDQSVTTPSLSHNTDTNRSARHSAAVLLWIIAAIFAKMCSETTYILFLDQ